MSASPGRLARFFSPENRYLPPLFITCILLAGHLTFGILESAGRTALAILTAIACELLLSRSVALRWPHLASAYITGISVGILIRSPYYWPYALCSAISITSKYALRVGGRHIWNPSNFGVSVMLFLANDTVASLSVQWGNQIWATVVIWILGSVIVGRLGRFHITLSYVVAFVVLAAVRSAVTGHAFLASVAPLTGPMYQLFVFFMITDPKTTVSGKRAQCAVAVLVAVAEMVFRLLEVIHAPYYALFVVGPAANVVEMMLARRGAAATAAPLTEPAAAGRPGA